jgi:hypothetical protein
MSNITGTATIGEFDLYQVSSVLPSGYSMGQKVYDPNGKTFRLALTGGSALVMGNLLQEAVADTQFINMGISAAAVGDRYLTVTNGTTTVTANQFDGGTISTYTAGTVAIGDQYTIIGHTTGTSGATLLVYLDRPVRTAMTTSAKVSMFRSPWSSVIQAPATTQTGMPVGVALTAAAATSYAWVQTHGVAAVLSDGSTFAIGTDVGTPSGTAGAVTVFAAGTTHTTVGVARQAAASAHAIEVFLRLD